MLHSASAAAAVSSAPITARASGQSGLVNSQLLRGASGGGGGGGSGGGAGAGSGRGAAGGGQNVYPDSSPEAKGLCVRDATRVENKEFVENADSCLI